MTVSGYFKLFKSSPKPQGFKNPEKEINLKKDNFQMSQIRKKSRSKEIPLNLIKTISSLVYIKKKVGMVQL